MNLLKEAHVAICNVKIAHAKKDLSDYEKVMEYYNPSIVLFDKILERIEELNEVIKNLEDIRSDANKL